MAVHPAVRTVEPEAEGHDDAALQGSQHPAGDGPPPIPDPVELLLVVREVHVPWQRRSERAQGVGDLPFEVVQDQPGAFRNRRRLELVVEGLDVAREERRGFGQSLQQVIDGGHLLVEAEGERLGGLQGTASDRAPLLSGAREQQGRGDDAAATVMAMKVRAIRRRRRGGWPERDRATITGTVPLLMRRSPAARATQRDRGRDGTLIR